MNVLNIKTYSQPSKLIFKYCRGITILNTAFHLAFPFFGLNVLALVGLLYFSKDLKMNGNANKDLFY